jgi:RNase P/RNase MRP subunit p29
MSSNIMKKPIKILALAILSLSFVSTAFTDDDKVMMKDHIMMKDGKVMMIKEGKSMPMDKEIALSDGTKVTVDGAVTMKDGKKMMMKEGEMMSMDGEMIKHDAKDQVTKDWMSSVRVG